MKGVDPFSLAQEGERLCRQSNYKAGLNFFSVFFVTRFTLAGFSALENFRDYCISFFRY